MSVRDNLAANAASALQKQAQTDQSWSRGSGNNDVNFVNFRAVLPGPVVAQADQQVKLTTPYSRFLLVPLTANSLHNGIYFHLAKLGKLYSGSVITPDGTEAWLALTNFGRSSVLKFAKPINEFYLDFDFASGTAYAFTIFCFNEDFDLTPDFFLNNVLPSVTVSGPVTVVQPINVVQTDSNKATYSASFQVGNVGLFTTNPFFQLAAIGVPNKICKVRALYLSFDKTAGALEQIAFQKQTAQNVFSGPLTATTIPHDSANPPAQFQVTGGTGWTSGGAQIGLLRLALVLTPAASVTANPTEPIIWNDLNGNNYQPATLRGPNETFSAYSVATLTGGTCSLYITWTEE